MKFKRIREITEVRVFKFLININVLLDKLLSYKNTAIITFLICFRGDINLYHNKSKN